MKAFDLWEALTDVEDEQLLQAEEPCPPKRGGRIRHVLAAACLALVLLTTAFLGTTALKQDTTMRYTIRYRENRVTYLCKVNAYREAPLPRYEPKFLPEGYIFDRESCWDDNNVSLVYRSTEVSGNYIAFSYTRIAGEHKMDLYTLPMGSYEQHAVTVNGLPGQLYLYKAPRTGGELIWLDEENCLLLHISFPEKDPTAVLTMANSIAVTS